MKYYDTELRNKNRGYMKLIVWQKAIQLFDVVWSIAFKESKIDFKLRSQWVDAAQSISANIAEGYGRRSINEYIQFLYYALGSLAETMTRAVGVKQTQQISSNRFREFDSLHYEVENRLLRLVEKLEEKRDDAGWVARGAHPYSITPSLHHSMTPSLQSYA
jgi:four helix bundle protein